MNSLKSLKPFSVFHYFEEICSIPHTSHHEKQLSDYCVRFAQERGLSCIQDTMGNLIIFAPASPGYEQKEAVILQGHLDMVGVKTENCDLDLEKDGLRLLIDGEYLTAEGTTLGGDDGIAVAYALALLDDKEIPHPPLEIVLTVCEEVGLLGASAMDFSQCKGRRLINIDSEEEGVLTVGCAGGRRAACRIPVERNTQTGLLCHIRFSGLLGGHSGLEIHKKRGNAIELLGRFLLFLKKETDYSLVSMSGGIKENAIPKSSQASILISEEHLSRAKQAAETFLSYIKTEYGATDPEIHLELTESTKTTESAITEASLLSVLTALTFIPCGVQAMSADIPDTVETSLNPGIMELTEKELTLRISIRSSVSSSKETLAEKISLLVKTLGGHTEFQGDYPAWPYAKESPLRDCCVNVFEELYGKSPLLQTIHAGLECGILSSKIPGLDCISFGPNQLDVHTPDEKLHIPSVERVWEYLKAVLKAL